MSKRNIQSLPVTTANQKKSGINRNSVDTPRTKKADKTIKNTPNTTNNNITNTTTVIDNKKSSVKGDLINNSSKNNRPISLKNNKNESKKNI